MFHHLKVNDGVIRILCGATMPLKITEIKENSIMCGDWEFHKETGFEIDEYLDCDGLNGKVLSYIVTPEMIKMNIAEKLLNSLLSRISWTDCKPHIGLGGEPSMFLNSIEAAAKKMKEFGLSWEERV